MDQPNRVPCAGRNCGATDGRHSRECIEEAAACQGWTPTAEELAAGGLSRVAGKGRPLTASVARRDCAANINPSETAMTDQNAPQIIPPTVGRKVWFYPGSQLGSMTVMPSEGATQPLDATIVYVWSDHLVNLLVVDHAGMPHAVTSVHLMQPGDQIGLARRAEWMPYQVGQAKRQAAATDNLPAPMPEPTPENILRVCETLRSWRLCLSYNESYAGERPGLLKELAAQIDRAMPVSSLGQVIAEDYGVTPDFCAQDQQGEAPPTPLEVAAHQVKTTGAALKAARTKLARLEGELEIARQEKRQCAGTHERAMRELSVLAGADSVAVIA